MGMLEDALLRRRLGWFGHVERRDERDALGRVWLVEPFQQLLNPGKGSATVESCGELPAIRQKMLFLF